MAKIEDSGLKLSGAATGRFENLLEIIFAVLVCCFEVMQFLLQVRHIGLELFALRC